jgi:hypothetical protein
MIKFHTSLNWDAAQSIGSRLRGLRANSEVSQGDSKQELQAAVLALVDELFSRDDNLHQWIETEHGFAVSEEAELKNVPPLKPGWKVAKFVESADYGDGHEDPIIGWFYVALPLEAKFDWPGGNGEVNVKDYQDLTVSFYRKRQIIKLPEGSLLYQDGEWQSISQID